MTEGKQIAVILGIAAGLMGIGLGGAILFPEECADLEQLGSLDLQFADAVDALPVEAEVAAALEGLGDRLGIGPFAGAVAVPADAAMLPSQSGIFVIADGALVPLRPLIGIASAPRGLDGLELLPSTDAVALHDPATGEIGVFDGEYELERCGVLVTSDAVLDLDRGFVATAAGDTAEEVTLRTLADDVVWTVPVDHGALPAVVIDGDTVRLVSREQVETRSLRTGDVLAEVDTPGLAFLLDARDGRLLLVDVVSPELWVMDDASGSTVSVQTSFPAVADMSERLAGVLTPHGVVALTATTIFTDRGMDVAFPDGVEGFDVTASQSGFVAVLIEVDGVRAVLFFGPDSD